MSDEPEHLDVEDEKGRVWRLRGPFVVLNQTIEYDPSDGIETTELAVVPVTLTLPKDP